MVRKAAKPKKPVIVNDWSCVAFGHFSGRVYNLPGMKDGTQIDASIHDIGSDGKVIVIAGVPMELGTLEKGYGEAWPDGRERVLRGRHAENPVELNLAV